MKVNGIQHAYGFLQPIMKTTKAYVQATLETKVNRFLFTFWGSFSLIKAQMK